MDGVILLSVVVLNIVSHVTVKRMSQSGDGGLSWLNDRIKALQSFLLSFGLFRSSVCLLSLAL